ncbi:hypothetical protein H2248_011999 [Termitomyces sp. 'cryptogamus']|nr:hypothetical protein H2248_011999 [Termitomyces sp. 'cryptogamus']
MSTADSEALFRDPSKIFFQADHVRRSIIVAYWLIIIAALPLWWHTTSIERLSLPSSRVIEQARHNLRVPVRIGLQPGLDRHELQKQLESMMPRQWEGLYIHLHETDDNGLHGSRSTQYWTKSSNFDGSYTVHDSEKTSVYGRRLVFPTASTFSLASTLSALIAPPISHHRVVQYSPRYRLSFTLLNEDASAGNSFLEWDVKHAIHYHIQPVLTQLKGLHNFTIESQVQFHAPLAFTPRTLETGFGIEPEDLTVFVNSADWTLSSSVSNDPVLHFVIFVPSTSRRPLRILDQNVTVSPSISFLLPQWGALVIFNPDESTNGTKLASSSLDTIFTAFSDHLLALLGVPSLPPNIVKTSNELTQWQLDALLRYRTLGNFLGSQDTLRSIVSLVDQIENMPVGQDVRGDVQGALSALEETFKVSKESLIDTFRFSARALTLSSRAFFNPGMLAMLYFPAEHKYAVYTPLFASTVIPVLVAALREIAAWRRQRKAATSEGEQSYILASRQTK